MKVSFRQRSENVGILRTVDCLMMTKTAAEVEVVSCLYGRSLLKNGATVLLDVLCIVQVTNSFGFS